MSILRAVEVGEARTPGVDELRSCASRYVTDLDAWAVMQTRKGGFVDLGAAGCLLILLEVVPGVGLEGQGHAEGGPVSWLPLNPRGAAMRLYCRPDDRQAQA